MPPYLRRVLAPNPGPMTLEGTNTWVVGDPAEGPPVVVDPGPGVPDHLRTVLAAAGGRLGGIVLTHRHADHSEGAAVLAELAGCGVAAVDPSLCLPAPPVPRSGAVAPAGPVGAAAGDSAEGPAVGAGAARGVLEDGTVLAVGAVELTVHLTPGHTDDSCTLLLRSGDGQARLLTGDTVLGRGTTVIAADGDLGAYLESLRLLQRLASENAVVEILPGHGPRVSDPRDRLDFYRRHREERLDQVRAALAAGDETVDHVVERVYGDLDPALRAAAAQSVRAQLAYLSGSA